MRAFRTMETVTPVAEPRPSRWVMRPVPASPTPTWKGTNLNADRNQPVRGFDDEGGEQWRRAAKDEPQGEVLFRDPERVEGQFERNQRGHHPAPARGKGENLVFNCAKFLHTRSGRALRRKQRPDHGRPPPHDPDRHGEQDHDAGDRDLAELAQALRQLDPPGEPVAAREQQARSLPTRSSRRPRANRRRSRSQAP